MGPLGGLAIVLGALAGRTLAGEPPRLSLELQAQDPTHEVESARPILSIARLEASTGPLWSVLCERVPFDELMRALAKKAGLALQGSELLPIGASVSIQLERRPLEQVLDFVLGSQGLRYELLRGALTLLPPTSDSAELLLLAQEAWRTVEVEGEAQAASKARLAQGNLAEVRGDLEGAYHIYAELAEEHTYEESAEALYRAGRILQRLGHWAEAAQHFRTLASLEGAERLHAKARLELARASIELGDAKSALHLLNFLDAHFETQDQNELTERRLVRARAFNATHEYVEALRALGADGVLDPSRDQSRSLGILAEAFQGLGFEVEAARAWLVYAREALGVEERSRAFEKAAALALDGGDELGTLFVCREAAKSGADGGLGALAHRARARLGLEEARAPTTMHERLDRAEELMARDDFDQAGELLEGLFLARSALGEPDQARILAAWARVLLLRTGLERALEVLSKARDELQDPAAARTLDLAAAALLESQDRFDEAAAAYRGNY